LVEEASRRGVGTDSWRPTQEDQRNPKEGNAMPNLTTKQYEALTGRKIGKRRSPRAKAKPIPTLRQIAGLAYATWTIPLRTRNPLNGSHKSHWTITRERKREREIVAAIIRGDAPRLPVMAKLTRRGTGEMDRDGLVASLKSVRDEIAAAYGVDDKDSAKTIMWEYEQEHPAEYAVVVELFPAAAGEGK
jgi:hypothetical protein